MGRARLLAGFLAFLIALPSPAVAAQVGESSAPGSAPRAPSPATSTLPKLAPLMLALPLFMSQPVLRDQMEMAPVATVASARSFLLPTAPVPTGPPGSSGPPPLPKSALFGFDAFAGWSTKSLPRREAGWLRSGFLSGFQEQGTRSAWFDQRRVKQGADASVPALVEPGAGQAPRIAAEAVLDGGFRSDLKEIEALLPAEMLEPSSPAAQLRREVNEASRLRGVARQRAADQVKDIKGSEAKTARFMEILAGDAESVAADARSLETGRALLARYDAALPPAEKLDFSSLAEFRASIQWSRRLHRLGASAAFPFRSGQTSRAAAKRVREALLAELPQMNSAEFEPVARAIGVLVMADGTVYVAFSGDPDTLRVVLGGYEKAIEDRLNAGGTRRFRVLDATTPAPQGMVGSGEGHGHGEDNPYCAEKKLFSPLREQPGLSAQVSEMAVLWRGDPHGNMHGVPMRRDSMQPCKHCIKHADLILGKTKVAAR